MTATTAVAIRVERPADHPAIRQVNEAAFGGTEEATLVEALRASGAILLSLVAETPGGVIGHALFSRMSIETANGSMPAVALAPVAVLSAHQRHGIGGQLIRAGLEEMRSHGERIVIVVGHPAYYPRFGFSSERARNLDSPFPSDAFMALELHAGALEGVRGAVKYPEAFGL
jgi:putative acetyltransferase